MVRKIELLVHAGAPSRRSDDERYMAQANAYLGFHGIVLRNNDIPATRVNRGLSETSHPRATPEVVEPDAKAASKYDATTFLEDTQLAWSALDSQLIPSSLLLSSTKPSEDLLESHRGNGNDRSESERAHLDELPRRDSNKQDLGSRHYAFESLKRGHNLVTSSDPSRPLGPDTAECSNTPSTPSSYLRSPDLHRSAKRQRVSDSQKEITSHAVPNAANLIPVALGVATKSLNLATGERRTPSTDVQRSQTSAAHNQSTSELPTSYSLSDLTSGSSRARHGISQRSSSDPGLQVASVDRSTLRGAGNRRKSFDNHASLYTIAVTVKQAATIAKPAASPSGVSTHEGRSTVQRFPKHDVLHEENLVHGASASKPLAALSTTIQPPVPPISIVSFTTHVTADLKSLVEDTVLKNCFRPAVVTTMREIRPLERGYWLIKSSETSEKWNIERQMKFWNFLEKYVGNGRAGWGVWCTRETESDESDSLGTVKVYCWGEIVKHLYYLLYVASSSQVRKLGLQWIDGGEQVVVQMRSA